MVAKHSVFLLNASSICMVGKQLVCQCVVTTFRNKQFHGKTGKVVVVLKLKIEIEFGHLPFDNIDSFHHAHLAGVVAGVLLKKPRHSDRNLDFVHYVV